MARCAYGYERAFRNIWRKQDWCRPAEGSKDRKNWVSKVDWRAADRIDPRSQGSEFRMPDLQEVKIRMAAPTVFDGRNIFDPQQMAALGFAYYSVGRRPVGR